MFIKKNFLYIVIIKLSNIMDPNVYNTNIFKDFTYYSIDFWIKGVRIFSLNF